MCSFRSVTVFHGLFLHIQTQPLLRIYTFFRSILTGSGGYRVFVQTITQSVYFNGLTICKTLFPLNTNLETKLTYNYSYKFKTIQQKTNRKIFQTPIRI